MEGTYYSTKSYIKNINKYNMWPHIYLYYYKLNIYGYMGTYCTCHVHTVVRYGTGDPTTFFLLVVN